jgi:hypothetical protein
VRRILFLIAPLPAGGKTEAARFASALGEEAIVLDGDPPGTTPAPDRRAISARTAPNHLISSSSVGAHSSRFLFVVTILNVCASCDSSAFDVGGIMGGETAAGDAI